MIETEHIFGFINVVRLVGSNMKLDINRLFKASYSKSLLSVFLLGLLAALTGCGGGSYGTQLGSNGTVTVRGSIVDKDGKPLLNILISDSLSSEFTQTGDEGSFEISATLLEGQSTVALNVGDDTILDIPAALGFVTETEIAQKQDGSFELVSAEPIAEEDGPSEKSAQLEPDPLNNEEEVPVTPVCGQKCKEQRLKDKLANDAKKKSPPPSDTPDEQEPEGDDSNSPQALAAQCEEPIYKYIPLGLIKYLTPECEEHFYEFQTRYEDRMNLFKKNTPEGSKDDKISSPVVLEESKDVIQDTKKEIDSKLQLEEMLVIFALDNNTTSK